MYNTEGGPCTDMAVTLLVQQLTKVSRISGLFVFV